MEREALGFLYISHDGDRENSSEKHIPSSHNPASYRGGF